MARVIIRSPTIDPVQPTVFPEYNIINTTLTEDTGSGHQTVFSLGDNYYLTKDSSVLYNGDLVDDDSIVQTHLDNVSLGYPPLKVPVMKFVHGNDGSAVDEVYFDVALVNGHITVTGTIPTRGNWRLMLSRVNESLGAIGADWRLKLGNMDFLV